MCPFADFHRLNLDLWTNLQNNHCIGEQIFLVVMELLDNSHIYARRILGICLRFENNLSKMCPFADFHRLNLDLWTKLQNNHCIGEQIFFVVMEFLDNSHHICEKDFRDLPQIWK